MSRFDEEPDGDPHGECAARIAELEAAAREVVSHMEGRTPTRGWLRDNKKSREALDRLVNALWPRAALAGEAKAAPRLTDAEISAIHEKTLDAWNLARAIEAKVRGTT